MLKDYGTLWGFHGKRSKHSTVFSPETVTIKKLANLTANTKNYGQITLNTKPHSDPQVGIGFLRLSRSDRLWTLARRRWCVIRVIRPEEKAFENRHWTKSQIFRPLRTRTWIMQRMLKQTTTVTATRTSNNERFREQNNGFARAL